MAGRIDVLVTYAARRPWVPRHGLFELWARTVWLRAASAAARSEVSVRVIGAARSRSLNAHYRRKDKPTNVLSFAGAGMAPDGIYYPGELLICAPVVAREARQQGKSAEAHWAHMTVHGMLHLLGFDHERPAEARKMAATEIQILDRLGISNPYA